MSKYQELKQAVSDAEAAIERLLFEGLDPAAYEATLDQRAAAEKALEAKAFVEVNKITKDDVELSTGADRPWFGNIWVFVDWLRHNSNKRFAEWNGELLFQSDLKDGKMIATPAAMEDLQ